MITNQDKPTQGIPQTELNIGDGYNLLVGGAYRLIVGAVNLLGGITNTTKVSGAELWSTITTTWAGETRTWLDCASLFDNTAKQSSTMTNIAKP